jgi:very-short-patch-repair endonuclease
MRNQLLKLQKFNSTKTERVIGEIFKKRHIKFKAKQIIAGREIDFIVGRKAIEIDGISHKTHHTAKDTMLVKEGYTPLHISEGIKNLEELERTLINLIS